MQIAQRKFEQMTLAFNQPKNLSKVSLLVGSLGGAALVAIPLLSTKGFLIFIPYVALVIGFYLLVRKNSEISHFRRFAAGLASFMLASLILYFYLVLIANPRFLLYVPLWEHIWRLTFLLVTGVVINGVMTLLQIRSAKKLP